MALTLIGCSAPYAEAIEGRLNERGLPGSGHDIKLVCCDSEDRWVELREALDADTGLVIAVLPGFVLDHHVRALAEGAHGVVSLDTSSSITADVIEAALHGEVLLPHQAAHAIALLVRRKAPPTNLNQAELDLLKAVAAGQTIVDLAKARYFSERTVRRRLQGVYLKLGVNNRAEAMAAAIRMGIVD